MAKQRSRWRRWVVWGLALLFGLPLLALAGLWMLLFFPPDRDYLDSAIPRLQTAPAQIVTVRTSWQRGYHMATTLLDAQDRMLEHFRFGISCEKYLIQYGPHGKTRHIHYSHSDSSPSGYINIDTTWYEYDGSGRLRATTSRSTFTGTETLNSLWRISYRYAANGDTLRESIPKDTTTLTSVYYHDSWKRDQRGRLVEHFSIQINPPTSFQQRPDTSRYFRQRYVYNARGQRNTAYYTLMYLGPLYFRPGPDTIRYVYNERGRLVRETHRYTTDMRNKIEVDSTALKESERESMRWSRQRFFHGMGYGIPSNDRTDVITYRYERFDPARHVPLRVPTRMLGY